MNTLRRTGDIKGREAFPAVVVDRAIIFEENKKKNIKELSEKRIILESRPLHLGIIVTTWCNLQCIMCPSARHSENATLFEPALLKIKDLLPYLESMDWQGGEFFGFSHIKKIFELLLAYPAIRVEITTNGILLDQEWIELLLGLNSVISFSIDSTNKKTYEYIRRGAHFDILIRNLKLIKEIELKTGKNLTRDIFVVVMKSNIHELPNFISFAEEFGFRSVTFHPVQFLTSEENIFYNNSYDTDFLQKVMDDMRKTAALKNINLVCNLPGCSSKEGNPLRHNKQESNNGSPKPFCSYPWRSLWIDVSRKGDIFPDCWCNDSLGNIYQDNLLEAWNGIKMQGYRRKIIDRDYASCNKDCIELREGKIFCKHF